MNYCTKFGVKNRSGQLTNAKYQLRADTVNELYLLDKQPTDRQRETLTVRDSVRHPHTETAWDTHSQRQRETLTDRNSVRHRQRQRKTLTDRNSVRQDKTTAFTGVINKNDLIDEWRWRPSDNAPQSSDKCRPRLIVQHDHNACWWQQTYVIRFLFASTSTEILHHLHSKLLSQCWGIGSELNSEQ